MNEEKRPTKEDLYDNFNKIAISGRAFEVNKMKLLDLLISNLDVSIKKSIDASNVLSRRLFWLTFIGTIATVLLLIFTVKMLL